MVLYNISTAIPPDSHLSLFPFEPFRVPLIIIGVADGLNHASHLSAKDSEVSNAKDTEDGGLGAERSGLEDLMEILDDLQEQYPKALVHRVLLFDTTLQESKTPEGIIPVPPPDRCKTTTMKTVMCDITSLFLAELTTFAKSLQGLPSIESPALYQSNHGVNGHVSWSTNQAGTTHQSGRRSDHQSASRSETPVGLSEKGQHRVSMPAQLSSVASTASSVVAGTRGSSPSSKTRTPPPATSGDLAESHRSRADSPAGRSMTKSSLDETRRELINDRVEVQGFGSGSMNERARNRSKGRVGVIIGALHLLAGRWEDAIRESIENVNIAKANSDHLWHARALENILVSLIMLAWAGLDFQVCKSQTLYMCC